MASVAGSDYVIRFYLRYQSPVTNCHFHYQPRKVTEVTNKLHCACFREIDIT